MLKKYYRFAGTLMIIVSGMILIAATVVSADETGTFIQRGDTFLKSNQFNLAEQEYQKAWEITPTLEPTLRTKLGVMLAQQQRWIEAAEAFEKAARLDPNNVVIHFNLANVYASMDLPEKGIAEYEKILKIQPNLYWAEFNMSHLYLEQKNYEKAIIHAKRALKINSKLAPIHFYLATLYEGITMIDKAIEEYQTAISLDPKHAKAHYNLGLVYLRMHKFDKAIRFFKKTTAIDPKFAEAYVNLGAVKMYQKEPEKAIPFFKKALALNPPNRGGALVNISVAYRDIKKYDDALKYARKAEKIGYKPAVALIKSIQQKMDEKKI